VLFLGIFAVSTSSVFIRLAQREAPSLAVAAYRLSMASLVLLPLIYRSRKELQGLTRKQWLLLGMSGAFLAVHFATWISSLAYTSVVSSVILVTTTPLWVALFSPLFLNEPVDSRIWIGLVIALSGGILVGLNDACVFNAAGLRCSGLDGIFQGQAFWGNLLALAGAWMAAGYMILGRKIRPVLSLNGYIGIVYPAAAVFLLMIAFASGTRMSGFSPMTYFWFGALALIPQLLGHTSYNYALGFLPAAYVAIAVLAEPIGSSLLAVVALKEIPTAVEVIGGGVILLGIGLVSWRRK
jgi:drug/metabolite transporter (DMT)-like permease